METYKSIKNPPEKSGLVLVRVGTTLDAYISYYRADRKLFEIWGAGRKEPVTDMNVVCWMNIPSLGKCVECKNNEASMDYNGHLHLVCGPCYEKLEKEFEEEYR